MLNRARNLAGQIWRTVEWRVKDRGRHYAARVNRRRLMGVTFIGITGSAGKTTTKDLVAGMLSQEGQVRSVPLSPNDNEMVDRLVAATRRADRYSVVEVGATRPGSLDRSLRALRPSIGVLTVIAQEHHGTFRSLESVAAEKRKLIDLLPASGVAVLNLDDPRIRQIASEARVRVIGVGRAEDASIRILDVSSSWPEPLTLRIGYGGHEHTVRTSLHGRHLAVPVLCALGVGLAAGLPIERAIAGLASVPPVEGRMQVLNDEDGVAFIRDDFKSPEWSFPATLEFLHEARAARKIAVIGTISDSKIEDRRRYAKAARQALEVADLVILAASATLSTSRAMAIADDARLKVFRNVQNAADFLKTELRAGDLVLLKGTNKQDHLLRIVLHRTRQVKCWDMTCGREGFCGTGCRRVYEGPPVGDASIGLAQDMPWLHGTARAPRPIVIGVGNPGAQYAGTPHNVAQDLLDGLAREAGASWVGCPEGNLAEIVLDGAEAWLFKARSFVNLTGHELAALLRRVGGSPEDCIVVIDDLALGLGVARLKRDGGDGGHKGMRSIVGALATDEILRVRIGVARGADVTAERKRVLEPFSAEDMEALAPGLARARELLASALAEVIADRAPPSSSPDGAGGHLPSSHPPA